MQKVTKEILKILLDEKTLFQWAGKSLDERAVLLHRRYPLQKITGSYIGQLYRQNCLTRKAVVLEKTIHPKLRTRIAEDTQIAKEDLQDAFDANMKVYYLDECMFTTQTYTKRDYAPKYKNMTVSMSQFNIQSTAFVGVVS